MRAQAGATGGAVTGGALEPAVAAAEAVLAKRFGATIRLGEAADLGGSERSTVLRAKVVESPFSLPKTLVVKHYGPAAGQTAAESFAKEAVSYQLFTALAEEDRMCPELFAHDAAERVLVLEDLGDAPTLADTLLARNSTAAERALLSLARSLGRMHASTAAREADFDALMRRLGTPCAPDPVLDDGRRALAELPGLLESALGVTDSRAAELAAGQLRALLEGGGRRAFSPSDLCPDNNLITGKGVRFLDFEGGGVRDVLLDAAYLRVPFPSCWCAFALPQGMSEAMVAGWRAEVTGVWPDLADDDVLLPQLLDAQLFWVCLSTWWFLPVDGAAHTPVDAHLPSPRRGAALSSRWRRLAEDAARLDRGWLHDYADAVVAGFSRRSPDDAHLAPYPAFR